jgi:hypothetical protein
MIAGKLRIEELTVAGVSNSKENRRNEQQQGQTPAAPKKSEG